MLDVKIEKKIRVFIENFMEKYSYWRQVLFNNPIIILLYNVRPIDKKIQVVQARLIIYEGILLSEV